MKQVGWREKYMLAMMKVDKAEDKLDGMLFRHQFQEKLEELTGGIETLSAACEEVKKSARFKQLMAMTLMLGNQINTGGQGTIATGFTLDALSKFAEVGFLLLDRVPVPSSTSLLHPC